MLFFVEEGELVGHALGYAAGIAVVVVALDVAVVDGLDASAGRQAERDVFYGLAAGEPLLLVVCLDFLDGIVVVGGIEVVGLVDNLEAVGGDEARGVGVDEGAVRLDIDDAAVAQDAGVDAEKAVGRQAFRSLLHLRVGEGNPDLADFAGGEK